MVRLNVRLKSFINSVLNRFNSKMVRLNVRLVVPFPSVRRCFNSKMVRLNAIFENVLQVSCNRFQFQDGSIKCTAILCCAEASSWFQFQDGSIKWSVTSWLWMPGREFQFQDGSIKCFWNWHQRCEVLQFQFQDGSIKCRKQYRNYQCCFSFNSKMVRLNERIKFFFQFLMFVSIPRWFD